MVEQWRPVPGYEGRYQVSDQGNVRSLHLGRLLKPGLYQYKKVFLRGDDGATRMRYVHALVLEAFVGPRPEGEVVRHLNGEHYDNRLENLTYGTPSQNRYDSVVHGTHHEARKTECINGHEYTPENTILRKKDAERKQRICRACRADRRRAYKQRKRQESASMRSAA